MDLSPSLKAVYEGDRARFLALLFAPAEQREDIATLYALGLELARIPALVSEPVPGEIRLQWWREVLSGERRSEAMQNPLAMDVLQVMAKYNLPAAPLLSLLEARNFDLYSDPVETVKQLEGYAGETVSSLMQLAAIILNNGKATASSDAAGFGGVAITIANIMAASPYTLSQGQTYVPLEILSKHAVSAASLHAGILPEGADALVADMCELGLDYLTKARSAAVEPETLPAFLELATVGPLLNRIKKQGANALKSPVGLPVWRKQWHSWQAARRGRV